MTVPWQRILSCGFNSIPLYPDLLMWLMVPSEEPPGLDFFSLIVWQPNPLFCSFLVLYLLLICSAASIFVLIPTKEGIAGGSGLSGFVYKGWRSQAL